MVGSFLDVGDAARLMGGSCHLECAGLLRRRDAAVGSMEYARGMDLA
jgi:hypothetical protein